MLKTPVSKLLPVLFLILVIPLFAEDVRGQDTVVYNFEGNTYSLIQQYQSRIESGSPEDYLVAADAALDLFEVGTFSDTDWLRRGLTITERLTDSLAGQPDAHYLRARALDLEIRALGVAPRIEQAREIRRQAKKALSADTNHVMARTLLARWHHDYAHGARRLVFEKADKSRIDPLFQRAVEESNRDIPALYHYAVSLDERGRTDELSVVVEDLLEQESNSVLEHYYQYRARVDWKDVITEEEETSE